MKVYHFLSLKYGFQDIANKCLKVATVNDLNDPFELQPFLGNNKAERMRFREMRDEFNETFGLLCFSKNWTNPVQWAHYADSHRGLCLGFDVLDDALTPVKYVEKRPAFDRATFTIDNIEMMADQMTLWFTTKYIHWQYEQEMRMFVDIRGSDPDELNFFEFDESLRLSEVILGHRCPASAAHMVLFLGELSPSVPVYQARLASESYRVVRQKCVPSKAHLSRVLNEMMRANELKRSSLTS